MARWARVVRYFVVLNLAVVVCAAWRVCQGGSIPSTMSLGLMALVLANGALALNLWLNRGRPKPVPSERIPWGRWAKSNALGVGLMALFAGQGLRASDLVFLAVLMFGIGNLLTLGFWLWDRHTERARPASENPSAQGGRLRL